MLLGIISDIHANLEALTAVLARLDARRVEEIVCLGDIVGYGPDPGPCVDVVRDRCAIVVAGNHDEWALTPPPYPEVPEAVWQSILWTAARLSDAQRAFLAGLPLVAHRDDMLFVHSAPTRPHAWEYIIDEESTARHFAALTRRICFVGHSHLPGIYAAGGEAPRYIVNVGSVGQPRDGNPEACALLMDTGREAPGCFQFLRVPYPFETTREKIRATDLPPFFGYRIGVGR